MGSEFNDPYTPINFLNEFSIHSIQAKQSLSLHEEELVANTLLKEITKQTTKYHKEYNHQLPDYLETFKDEYEKLEKSHKSMNKLPVMSLLSPRSKKKLSLLPAPNDIEKEKIKQLEKFAKQIDSSQLYQERQPLNVRHGRNSATMGSDNTSFGLNSKVFAKQFQLAPKHLTNHVNNSSIMYYDSIEQTKKRKIAQSNQIAHLLNEDLYQNEKVKDSNYHEQSDRDKNALVSELMKLNNPIGDTVSNLTKLTTSVPQFHSDLKDFIDSKTLATGSIAAQSHFELKETLTNETQSEKFSHNSKPFHKVQSFNGIHSEKLQGLKNNDLNDIQLLYQTASPRKQHNASSLDLLKSTIKRSAATVLTNESHTEPLSKNIQLTKSSSFNDVFRHQPMNFLGIETSQLTTSPMITRTSYEHISLENNFISGNTLKTEYEPVIQETFDTIQNIYSTIDQTAKEFLSVSKTLNPLKEKEYLNEFSVEIFDKIGLDINQEYNRNRIKKKVQLRQKATLIQKMIRGFIKRKIFQRKVAEIKKNNLSATIIQCAFRIYCAKRKKTVYQKIKFVQNWLNEVRKMKKLLQEFFCQNGAEMMITKYYRAYKIRMKLQKLIYWNHFKLAIIIQRYFRGFQARKLMKRRLIQFRNLKEERKKAAILFQCMIRGYLARLKYAELVEKKEKKLDKRYAEKMKRLKNVGKDRPVWWYWMRIRKKFPFKYLLLNRKVLLIQKVWRGHHGRIRANIRRIRNTINKINKRNKFLFDNAQNIQRIWRGYSTRLNIRKQKQRKLILRIQCCWRQYAARAKIRRIQHYNKHATIIIRNLFRLHKIRKFRKLRIFHTKIAKKVLRIQQWFRKILAKWKVSKLRSFIRIKKEFQNVIQHKISALMSTIQLRILVDTVDHPIGHRYLQTFSGIECLCCGPFQGVFVQAICSKGRTDTMSLITNKVDAGSLLRFMNKIPLTVGEGSIDEESYRNYIRSLTLSQTAAKKSKKISNTDEKSIVLVKDKKIGQSSRAKGRSATSKMVDNSNKSSSLSTQDTTMISLQLLDDIILAKIELPKPERKISPTQLDIAFNKSKGENNASSILTYAELLSCLSIIADYQYSVEVKSKKRSRKSKERPDHSSDELQPVKQTLHDVEDTNASISSINMTDSIDQNTNASIILPTDKPAPSEPVNSQSNKLSNKNKIPTKKVVNKKMKSIDLTWPIHSIQTLDSTHHSPGNQPLTDYRLLFIVKIFLHYRNEVWMTPLIKWMVGESYARIGHFVIRIQSLYRRRKAYKTVEVQLQERKRKQLFAHNEKLSIKIQSLLRMFLYRRKVATMAQTIITKYAPLNGPPYWYNPYTRVKSWQKPKILQHLEAYTVAVPEPGLENTVNCYYCFNRADVNCHECEDSMCKICYESLHCKGHRSSHTCQSLPSCSYCKYQVATKKCTTCMLKKPVNGTIQETMTDLQRGMYCDSCYIFQHDSAVKKRQNFYMKKQVDPQVIQMNGLVQFANSKEAYLLQEELRRKIITHHNVQHLVQLCEECSTRSSTWRCNDCHQVYCGKCLVGLHSLGGPFSRHTAEPLPYYTPVMHKSFQKDFTDITLQKKFEKVKRQAIIDRNDTEYRATIKIQSWWRMIYMKRIGRLHMKTKQRQKRIEFRNRQRENKNIRSTLLFKCQNAFGFAPELSSDSLEEKVLRKIPSYHRQVAREYIWRNVEDWGFYRTSRTIPRKGQPKRGFEVGTVEELQDQTKFGGYRLPGYAIVTFQLYQIKTTCDLSPFLVRGDVIRIRNHFFAVVDFKDLEIVLNRPWMEDSTPETNDETDEDEVIGEVMYRVPWYKNEPDRFYFKMKYKLFDWTLKNPVTKGVISGYSMALSYYLRWVQMMMRISKQGGSQEDYENWKKVRLRVRQRMEHVAVLNIKEGEVEDVSKLEWDWDSWPDGKYNNVNVLRRLKRAEGDEDFDLLTDEELLGHDDPFDSFLASQSRKVSIKSSEKNKIRMERVALMEQKEKEELARVDEEYSGDDMENSENDDDVMDDGTRKKPARRKVSGSSSVSLLSPRSLSTRGHRKKKDYSSVYLDDEDDETNETNELLSEGDDVFMDSISTKSMQKRKKSRKSQLNDDGENSNDMETHRSTAMSALTDDMSQKSTTTGKSKRAAARNNVKKEKPSSKKLISVSDDVEEVEEEEEKVDSPIKNMKEIKTFSDEEFLENRKKLRAERSAKKKNGIQLVDRLPGVEWFANPEESELRREREDKMTSQELALEANEWKEAIDIMTENIYYVNILTLEKMTTIPRAVQCKRQLEFENSRNKKNYDEAQKRIQRFEQSTKNRLFITGVRKK